MAQQASREDLRQQALDKAGQYKTELDEILGNEPDEDDQGTLRQFHDDQIPKMAKERQPFPVPTTQLTMKSPMIR